MKFKKLTIYIFVLLTFFTFVFSTSTYADTTNIINNVNANAVILFDSASGKIIFEKNAYEKMYPASTTKIMTAILTLENCKLSDTATVSENAIKSVPPSYTNANLQVDETLTIEQLLNVLLIPSANDAANVLAEHIAGSVESFSSMMNTKAVEIGCLNTHFVNPNGVHNEEHYSTAYDLALIAQYAMKNDEFRKLVGTLRYTLPVTNKYDKEDRVFINTNRLINPKNSQYYSFATGLKTGYTDAAKNCLVASAKKDNLELIAVVLGAGSDNETNINKFASAINLFEYGFNNFSNRVLCSKNSVFKVVNPKNASKDTNSLNILYENEISVLVNNSLNSLDLSPEVELDDKISAPITKGSVIGKVTYTVDNIKYTTNLIAGQDIESNSIFPIIIKIAFILIALYILGKIFGNKNHKKKGKRKKAKHSKSSSSSVYKFNLY